ncbi:hypothetical protein BC828DRAFT_378134 [Blastocladiella britannica]|nr:hypothetical protein BC828DRAFT_378134 [Blastocladiella britannica]
MEQGMVGFFVSSTKGKERAASKEITVLLVEAIEELYPEAVKAVAKGDEDDNEATAASSSAAPKAAPTSIEDEIAAELTSLTDSSAKNHASEHLEHIAMAVDCLFFLRVNPPALAAIVDPVAVVRHVFETALAAKKRHEGAGSSLTAGARTRFAHRILPFQSVCKGTLKDIQATATTLLARAGVIEPCKFALATKLRVGSPLNRDELIQELAKPLIDAGYTVDLVRPDVSVVVEVYRNVAGVSVVTGGDYVRLRKFNLHEVYAKGEDVVAAAAADSE